MTTTEAMNKKIAAIQAQITTQVAAVRHIWLAVGFFAKFLGQM